MIDTLLNVCIDSDDYMPDDAVETILRFWETCDKDDRVYGVLALDEDKQGNIIGTRFPKGVKRTTSYDLYNK